MKTSAPQAGSTNFFSMENEVNLPQSIRKAQDGLKPYVKQRSEATSIRKILAAFINARVGQDGNSLLRPLALASPKPNADLNSGKSKSLQSEYLQCVHANRKARQEFASLSKEHTDEDLMPSAQRSSITEGSLLSVSNFLEIARQRHRHDRLRIIHDYVDVLCQKPAATVEYLEPELVLRDVENLPKVPPEVLNVSIISQPSGLGDLAALVEQLEKSVLRAKLLLKREQQLLDKIKSKQETSVERHGSRIQALGSARNELISWIETELARTGDGSTADMEHQGSGTEDRGTDFVSAQLASIQRQYSRYIAARNLLILSATGNIEIPQPTALVEGTDLTPLNEIKSTSKVHVLLPYLDHIVAISNEQKDIIQQKSYLTTSLAKQLKETNQGLDRLAEESHLLLSYTISRVKSQEVYGEVPTSFRDDISRQERPESSQRAQPWAFAAEQSGRTTQASVYSVLEEGGLAVEQARETLKDLHTVTGMESMSEVSAATDIWAALDGTLGVIKGNGEE